MAKSFFNTQYKTFVNFHYNYQLENEAKIVVKNERDGDKLTRYNDAADHIQNLIGQALNTNKRFRPFGSRWSLSEAPYGKDWMVDNRALNLIMDIDPSDLHPNNPEDASNFIFAQSGNFMKELTLYLESRDKSLKTSGASNGQTIAGAMSTGVHGSSIDFGSVQDFVAGINLIVSPTRKIYIERASRPILNDQFGDKIDSEVIRDDDLFNAALVSLGAFGFIHGVVVEAEDIFLLERHIVKLHKRDALELATQHNFETTSIVLPHPGERPFHYKLYVHPYKFNVPHVAEIFFKRPFRPHPNPNPTIRTSFYRDLPTLLGILSTVANNTVPGLINLLSGQIFPDDTDPVIEGTLGEVFYDTAAKGAVFGCAIGCDISQSERVLNALNTLMVLPYTVPGILSLRFVKGTQATLGFTRFPHTAIVEVDGVKWNKLDDFMVRVCALFSNTPGLDFTLHWGKNADWSPALVTRMYGSRIQEWKLQRDRIITHDMKRVFTSQFLIDTGLG